MPLNFPRQSPCEWVGGRLPLFVGDELPWTERRKIERHLIVCDHCRSLETAHSSALEVLNTAAGVDPTAGSASELPFLSIWPSLSRQIQAAKHASGPPALSWEGARSWLFVAWDNAAEGFAGLSLIRFRWIPVLMSALLLVSVTLLGVGSWVRWTEHLSRRELADAARPIRHPETPSITRARGPALPSEDPQLAKNEGAPSRSDRAATSSRFSYDLDHGTPLGPNSIDIKPSY